MTGLQYLFVAQLLIGLMLAVIFLLAWKTVERKPHTLTWSILFFVATLNSVLNAQPGIFPSRDVYWVVVNATSLAIQALAWVGFRQRAGLTAWPRYLVPLLVVIEALVVWFTVVTPHVGLRMVWIPYSGGLAMVACIWALARADRKLRAAERGAVAVLALHSLGQFAAGTVALLQGSTFDQRYLDLYSQINFLATPAAFTGIGLFTVFILADDLAERMRRLAVTDQLTGVLNRRGFEEAADHAVALSRRQRQPLCVALADLDRFKAINDTHGHIAGDQALAAFAAVLARGIRSADIVGRIGGEEFAVLLPATALAAAAEVVERLRQTVEITPVEIGSKRLRLTTSFGLAALAPGHESIRDSLREADRALYAAKEAGRNRVEIAARAV